MGNPVIPRQKLHFSKRKNVTSTLLLSSRRTLFITSLKYIFSNEICWSFLHAIIVFVDRGRGALNLQVTPFFLKQKNFFLNCFLCDLVSPLVPNDYSCKDTFSFVFQFKNANLSKKFLVFCDVTSLFTNIPLQETIGIAINLFFNHNPNPNITRKHLKNFSFWLHHRLILFLTISFIIKLIE